MALDQKLEAFLAYLKPEKFYGRYCNLIDDMMALSYVRLHDYARGRAMTQDRDGRHDLSVQWMQQDYLRDGMPLVHGL